MPTFETTHVVELTITHRVEAATAEEAHGIAVEQTVARIRQLEVLHPGISFGPVDDRFGPPKKIG